MNLQIMVYGTVTTVERCTLVEEAYVKFANAQ
jgi:hypothetical protein